MTKTKDRVLFKEEIDKECLEYIEKYVGWETFVFLKNYHLTARNGRMELASLCYENYKDICSGKYDRYFSHLKDRYRIRRKKEFICEFLQVDLLSKTMMLIEDLSTISSALEDSVKKLPHYIFNHSNFDFINNLYKKRDTVFLKIIGLPSTDELGMKLDAEEEETYKKIMRTAAKGLKTQYERIKAYKDKHYDFYIGYKHSYSRIFAGHSITSGPKGTGDELLRFIFLIDKNKSIRFHSGCLLVHNELQFKAGISILNLTFYIIDTIILNILWKVQHCDYKIFPALVFDKKNVADSDLQKFESIRRKVESGLKKHDDFGVFVGYKGPVDMEKLRTIEEKEAGLYTEFGRY